MAKTYPSGATGAVVLPTGHGADIASFDYGESQATESVAFYGTNLYNPMRGSGTFEVRATCAAFAAYGASGFAPGFGAATNIGSSSTFTVATGVTMVGQMVVSGIRLSHARLRAAVPLTFELSNSADTMVTTWPVS
jgi:hypothetical protein